MIQVRVPLALLMYTISQVATPQAQWSRSTIPTQQRVITLATRLRSQALV